MAPVFIAILSLTVLGIPFVLAVDRDAPPLRLLGLACLYGTGVIYFVLLALSVLHIRWSLISVTIAAVVITFPFIKSLSTQHSALRTRFHVVDLFALLMPLAFAFYATIAPLWEWDFWAIWGLKARVFFESGGIDWRFLTSPWNTFAHPDYPLLLPFAYDFVALLGGGWSDRWLGILFVAWAVAFLLVARELAARETTPLVAALVTFALSSLAVSRYVGLAEGTLIAYIGAGVLFVRRAMLFDDDVAWRHGAILLGLAACTKNEGLAMLGSTAIAIVVCDVRRWRRVVRFWPAAAIALPWLVLRALHDLPTDVVSGSIASRLLARLPEAGKIFAILNADLHEPWFWAALLLGIVAAPFVVWRRERFVLLACLFQLVIYVGVYFGTPRELTWHIVTSWPRLTVQIAAPLTYTVMIALANTLRETNAEARSEQP
jgi:hypothetical protein